jgi:DNA-binding MarR family transcriptional regulator
MGDGAMGPATGQPFDFDTAVAAAPIGQRVVTGLAKIGLATKHRAWQEAGDQGLTPTQGQALALLRLRPETGMRLAELADGLAVTSATASEAVRALVAKGLVHKVRSAADARALMITLTEAGQREADRVAGWSDFLLDAVDALTPPEQAMFLRSLVKMVRTLQERGEISVTRMCVTCRFFRPNVHPNRSKPHHCAFVDAPFGDRHLRLECADHEVAPAEQAQRAWEVFASSVD